MATLVGRRLTYAELCELPDDGVLWELLDGVPVTRASPTRRHQRLVGEMYARLRPAQDAGLGELVLGPFDVVLDEHNATLPDLIFIRAEHAHFVADTGCFGPPDLVVEVLSPSSIERDLEDKRGTYERFEVAGYWVLDLAGEQIRRFHLDHGRYVEQPTLGRDDVLTSPLFPALQIPVRELFASISRNSGAGQAPTAEVERVKALEEQHRRRPRRDRR